MHRIYSALIDIVAAAIFIVPLLALYGKISLRSLKQTLIYIVFAFYLVAVLSLVGFPSVLSLNLDFTINIIPLVDMISDFVNACLNVLLFVPLGFLLPLYLTVTTHTIHITFGGIKMKQHLKNI